MIWWSATSWYVPWGVGFDDGLDGDFAVFVGGDVGDGAAGVDPAVDPAGGDVDREGFSDAVDAADAADVVGHLVWSPLGL